MSCSRLTVGSSPNRSSPTSALAMALRMACDGLLTVSERRSTGAFMEKQLPSASAGRAARQAGTVLPAYGTAGLRPFVGGWCYYGNTYSRDGVPGQILEPGRRQPAGREMPVRTLVQGSGPGRGPSAPCVALASQDADFRPASPCTGGLARVVRAG